MNPIVKFIAKVLVEGKLSKILRAERFTGRRTQIALGIYLAALMLQVIGTQLGWDPELQDALELIKQAAIGAGGLALAAKVTRSGPEGKVKKPRKPRKPRTTKPRPSDNL
jgi:hypothetical protein